MQKNLFNNQADPSNLTAYAIRESIFAGIIAFGLFFFFIGLETTQNIRNELIIVPHWLKLAIVIAIVMVVRFLMITVVRPYLERQKAAKAAGKQVASEPGFIRRNFTGSRIDPSCAKILSPKTSIVLSMGPRARRTFNDATGAVGACALPTTITSARAL